MTQRIFDVENEKDMADLWDILPDDVIGLKKDNKFTYLMYKGVDVTVYLFKINWHDKTEITRPIQEATEADIGKICYFWDGYDENYSKQIGLLTEIKNRKNIFRYVLAGSVCFAYCRRLTKTEIEELI